MWQGWTRNLGRLLQQGWRARRRTNTRLAALDQTLNRLGVLYALDLQTRGVPTGTLLEEFARAAAYTLPEPVDPRALADDNHDRAQMRDEDFADLEALDQYGWSATSPEEQAAFLESLHDLRRDAAAMPRIYERAQRSPRERAHAQAATLPFYGV